MPTATYIALANLTLTGTDAEVSFASIPATFRDLVVITNVDGSTQTEMFVRLNGDTGNNYNTVRMHDKLARINNLVDSGKNPKHESIEDSFKDMAPIADGDNYRVPLQNIDASDAKDVGVKLRAEIVTQYRLC